MIVDPSSRLDSVGGITEEDLVEIDLKNFILREPSLLPIGKDRLLSLSN